MKPAVIVLVAVATTLATLAAMKRFAPSIHANVA
jgi:hypothetical protein